MVPTGPVPAVMNQVPKQEASVLVEAAKAKEEVGCALIQY
jgi:hypothetical protein